jgi:hypothetical protein
MAAVRTWRRIVGGLILGALIMICGVQLMAQENLLAVQLDRSGGQLPTYRPKFRIEVKNLSAADRAELERLLKEADFFQQPNRSSETGLPDAFKYTLTVETGEGSHTVVFRDQDGHAPALDALAAWLRAHKPQ